MSVFSKTVSQEHWFWLDNAEISHVGVGLLRTIQYGSADRSLLAPSRMAEIHMMNRSIHSRMAQQHHHSARRAYYTASERYCIIHFTFDPRHFPCLSHALDNNPRALQLFDDSSLRPCEHILQHAEQHPAQHKSHITHFKDLSLPRYTALP